MSTGESSPVTPDPDLALATRLRARDESAFEELVRRHGGRLLAVAHRILRDADEAQDAVQEGFLAAFRSLDSFDARCRLATWLHRIVVNQSLMKLRRRRPQTEASVEGLLPDFTEYGHHRQSVQPWRPEAAMELEESRQFVRHQIDLLPETYRITLVLRDLEERPMEEVAELLGVTVNAVKIRLHRARQALRSLLSSRMQEVSG